jgi:hypothetical protein
VPQHQYFHRVGPIPARNQDHQLQRLAKDHIPERQDHDRQHATSGPSHGGQNRTSAPMTEFLNGTGRFEFSGGTGRARRRREHPSAPRASLLATEEQQVQHGGRGAPESSPGCGIRRTAVGLLPAPGLRRGRAQHSGFRLIHTRTWRGPNPWESAHASGTVAAPSRSGGLPAWSDRTSGQRDLSVREVPMDRQLRTRTDHGTATRRRRGPPAHDRTGRGIRITDVNPYRNMADYVYRYC